MSKRGNSPAYPTGETPTHHFDSKGITIREYFIGKAIGSFMAGPSAIHCGVTHNDWREAARAVIKMADFVIQEMENGPDYENSQIRHLEFMLAESEKRVYDRNGRIDALERQVRELERNPRT